MGRIITFFKKYFSAMLLVVITLLIGCVFCIYWDDSSAWWEHTLLVLGAVVGEILALIIVCCNLERRYCKENADTSLFDAEELRTSLAHVLCCIGLTVAICYVTASILWIVITILLMAALLLFSLMAFFCVREVVYEPYSI